MTYRVMSERNIVDDDDKKSLKINNKISTHSFTAGSFDGTTRWIAFYFRLNMNETEELKKPKSEFVWFTFFVSYLFLFSWRQKKKPLYVPSPSTKSTKATAVQCMWVLWMHPLRWRKKTSTRQNQRYHHRRNSNVGSCICFVIITNCTRYYLLGGPSLGFFFFRCSVDARNFSCQTDGTEQQQPKSTARFIPKIKSESFHFHA